MRWRFPWVGLVAAIVVLVIAGLLRLRLDVEILNLLPSDVPQVAALKLYQQHFANSRELIVTLKGPTAAIAETAARQYAESLRRETNLLAQAVWQPPWLEHPEHLTELIACLWLNQPTEALVELTNRLAPEKLPQELSSVRDELATSLSPTELGRLAYDPFGFTRLDTGGGGDLFSGETQDWFSADEGTFRIIFVQPRTNLVDYHDAAAWMTAIRTGLTQCQQQPDWPRQVKVSFTGGPAFLAEIATSMEHDMRGSAIGTLILIAGLFWWAHRRWLPLLWLMALLVLIVVGAMGLGALCFGTLNIVSLGFAAILMGLAVDYALVLYQEWLAEPALSPAQLRRTMAPSIVWSAVTTAAAFALLNFGGLPGLSQLGTLVGIGVMLAAIVMLFAFLPVATRFRKAPVLNGNGSGEPIMLRQASRPYSRAPWMVTFGIALFIVVALSTGFPRVEQGPRALQLTDCPAQAALDELQGKLNRRGEPLLAIFSGKNEQEVATSLASFAQAVQTNNLAAAVTLPTALWPAPLRQAPNRQILGELAQQGDRFRTTVLSAGFTSNALALSDELFRYWGRFASMTNAVWPSNESCQWMVKRFAARGDNGWLALGIIHPDARHTAEFWSNNFGGSIGAGITSWPMIGEKLLTHVEHRLIWLLAGTFAILAGCLWLAFRSWRESLLSFVTLAFGGLVLLAIMRVAGWSWNLMNFMALPLLLGAGVDYTIHVQLALRRHGGQPALMRRITGRALFLCAATTVAGFGSLAWSSSPGLASLGVICATGIACVFTTALFLLPAWWTAFSLGKKSTQPGVGAPAGPPDVYSPEIPKRPSHLYRQELWQFGLFLVRLLPPRLCSVLCRFLACIYQWVEPARREVVIQNLLPALGDDRTTAEKMTRRLFRQFSYKLVDLWRVEAGVPIDRFFSRLTGWDHFEKAQARGRGVLIITPHLGNWELGGPLLAQRGKRLLVVTQSEPGAGFTELRQKSRARWGVETLVIGQDAFAGLEIIKYLQDDASVALLLDRPPGGSTVQVELFGRPFIASAAAAELAWASGCALIGVHLLRHKDGYHGHFMPEFIYDQPALNKPDARRALTQQILRAFEPVIREHLDQWYHFVPVWPAAKTGCKTQSTVVKLGALANRNE